MFPQETLLYCYTWDPYQVAEHVHCNINLSYSHQPIFGNNSPIFFEEPPVSSICILWSSC